MFEKYVNGEESFIIAEVGNNHQGSEDIAIEYVIKFAEAGANAIKFQTRDNKYLFSPSGYNAPYINENSFADTYGAHREKLELSKSSLLNIKKVCNENNVYFMSTPFDEPSVDLLSEIGVDLFKIASFDLGNAPLLSKISQKNKPIVLSTGGGKLEHIDLSVNLLSQHNSDLAILHCVSEYPCDYSKLGLSTINQLKKMFPKYAIGNSDHFNGILSGPIAYMNGARVFEKHVTLNRSWKGTDHSFSLEIDGFRKFCRDIRRVPKMMIRKDESDLGKEYVFQKLGKSIVASIDINLGDVFSIRNLTGKIYDNEGIPIRESVKLLGKKSKRDIKKNELINLNDF